MTETVLITGASSGIGLELARLFARDQCALVLVARSEERLNALAEELRAQYSTEVRVIPFDLSRPDAAKELVCVLSARGIEVDVLVNNAGFGASGNMSELSFELQSSMLQVNMVTLTLLTRLLLPGMLTRGRGGILNVGSVAGFLPGPYMAVYYATKAYVLSFTEAMAEELAGTGVTATCLAPGATATDFFKHEGMAHTKLASGLMASAASVARDGHAAFRKGIPLAVSGFSNKLLTWVIPLLPRLAIRKMAARINR